jgi:hypothetical protein
MDIADLDIYYQPKDRLRLTISGDRSYVTVKPVWAAPLTRPGRYLSLLDGKGKEIVSIPDPALLREGSRAAVMAELHHRYLTAQVRTISHARQEFGATYWTVETDRGPREFVTQNLQENALWLTDSHLLLVDVDNNRFEIANTVELDAASRRYVESIL